MKNKILAALVAGGLLVGAGVVSSIVSAPGTAVAQEAASDEALGHFPRGINVLGQVLDDLVAEGTITEAQAEAIVDAVEAKAEEIKEQRMELREMIREFLEDGVMTEAEAEELPEGHWLLSDTFDEAWEDGELTVEEIREARPHPRRDAFKKGARFGALLDDGGIDQAEYDSLGEDHPLKQIDVSEYLEDGLITPEELREIHQGLRESSGEGA